jgi:hypothetical protein
MKFDSLEILKLELLEISLKSENFGIGLALNFGLDSTDNI